MNNPTQLLAALSMVLLAACGQKDTAVPVTAPTAVVATHLERSATVDLASSFLSFSNERDNERGVKTQHTSGRAGAAANLGLFLSFHHLIR